MQKYKGLQYQCPKCDSLYAYKCTCYCGCKTERIVPPDVQALIREHNKNVVGVVMEAMGIKS